MRKTVLIIIGTLILVLLVISVISTIGQPKVKEVELPTEAPTVTPAPTETEAAQPQWIPARGRVNKIKDRMLTLVANGDSLTILIKENAMVKRVEEIGPEVKEIEFEEIKIGDEVVVQFEITTEGQFEGGEVFILPSPDFPYPF